MVGYVKLYRQIVDWEWYDDHNTTRLFIHLIVKANYQTKKWHGITIKKGSLVTSLDSLVSEVGLTKQQVRRCLKLLKTTREIKVEANNKYQVISITSYSKYQTETTEDNTQATHKEHADNTQTTHKEHVENIQRTPTKEVKEVKKKKDNLKVIQKEKSKKASRFNAERDFSTRAILPNNFLEYAINNGFSANDANEHFQNFADYWEGVPGNKGVKLDWLATWRNWLRRSTDFAPRQGVPQQKSKYEAIREIQELISADPRSHIRPKSKYAYLSEGD